MKEQTSFRCEICEKRFNFTLRLQTRLEFFLKIRSFVWKSTQDCIVRYVTKDLKDLNSYQKFIALIEIVNKILYVTKDSIWHWDLKTRLEYSSKIHSFEWNRKQDSIVKFVTKDLIWHLEWNGQNLSKICYKRLNFK